MIFLKSIFPGGTRIHTKKKTDADIWWASGFTTLGMALGGQSWEHQSSGLPTSIMTLFFTLSAWFRVRTIDFWWIGMLFTYRILICVIMHALIFTWWQRVPTSLDDLVQLISPWLPCVQFLKSCKYFKSKRLRWKIFYIIHKDNANI